MELKNLTLLTLRAIAVIGFAVILVLLGFVSTLLAGVSDFSFFNPVAIPFFTALAIPLGLWFAAPLVVESFAIKNVRQESATSLSAHELIPCGIVLISTAWIAEAMIEITLSIFSQLILLKNTLDAAHFAYASYGPVGFAQLLVGFALLLLCPKISRLLTPLTDRQHG